MYRKTYHEFISALSEDAIRYIFPGRTAKEILLDLSERDRRFDGVRFSVDGGPAPAMDDSDDIRFSKVPSGKGSIPFSPQALDIFNEKTAGDKLISQVKREKRLPTVPFSEGVKTLSDRGRGVVRAFVPEPDPIEPELDERTRALLDEIEALQRKYGVTVKQLEAVLSYRVKLSHLRITRRFEIILEDFDYQEVKMDTLTKAVFLLYLRHPKGIRYKDLVDYRRELEDIYLTISGRSDMDAIRKSISSLTDPIMSNSINEKVSKVKKAFRDVVGDDVARFYYIDGKQGQAKKIALDRSLVIWG